MAFTNTVSSAWNAFFQYMKQLENSSGGGSTIKITTVVDGEVTPFQYEVPFVSVQLLSSKVADRNDNNKRWEQQVKVRIVSQSPGTDLSTTEIAAKIAQVEDHIEAFSKPDGVSGFEDAEWSVTDNINPDEGNIVSADSTRKFSVVVIRGSN